MKTLRARLVLIPLILAAATLSAAVPQVINHQGKVSVNGTPFDGTGLFRFAIVDPDTGQNRWTNDGTVVDTIGTPTNGVSVAVADGIYTISLGDASLTNMTSVPSSVFSGDNLVLRIWFDDGVNGNQQLTPDHKLTTNPYSFRLPNIFANGPNVGIGIDAPTELLDVALNVRARGNLQVDGDASVDNKLRVGQDGTFEKNLRVGSPGVPSATLHVVNPGGRGLLVDDKAAVSPLATIQTTQWNDIGTVVFEVVADSDLDSGGPFQLFSVRSNGTIFGVGDQLFHAPSDLRLKKDVTAIPRALERVLRLRGVNFKWKDLAMDGDSLQIGMIAQEVEKVFPEAVHTAKDEMGTKAVEYEHLVGALIEAIKELDGIVKQRDAELDAQAHRIGAFEARLITLEARSAKVAQAGRGD